MCKTKADENSSLSLQVAITRKNTEVIQLRIPYTEEYQNNTVSQISVKISRMRKRLKPGVLSAHLWTPGTRLAHM